MKRKSFESIDDAVKFLELGKTGVKYRIDYSSTVKTTRELSEAVVEGLMDCVNENASNNVDAAALLLEPILWSHYAVEARYQKGDLVTCRTVRRRVDGNPGYTGREVILGAEHGIKRKSRETTLMIAPNMGKTGGSYHA